MRLKRWAHVQGVRRLAASQLLGDQGREAGHLGKSRPDLPVEAGLPTYPGSRKEVICRFFSALVKHQVVDKWDEGEMG